MDPVNRLSRQASYEQEKPYFRCPFVVAEAVFASFDHQGFPRLRVNFSLASLVFYRSSPCFPSPRL